MSITLKNYAQEAYSGSSAKYYKAPDPNTLWKVIAAAGTFTRDNTVTGLRSAIVQIIAEAYPGNYGLVPLLSYAQDYTDSTGTGTSQLDLVSGIFDWGGLDAIEAAAAGDAYSLFPSVLPPSSSPTSVLSPTVSWNKYPLVMPSMRISPNLAVPSGATDTWSYSIFYLEYTGDDYYHALRHL